MLSPASSGSVHILTAETAAVAFDDRMQLRQL
jgi:hypothetical protein